MTMAESVVVQSAAGIGLFILTLSMALVVYRLIRGPKNARASGPQLLLSVPQKDRRGHRVDVLVMVVYRLLWVKRNFKFSLSCRLVKVKQG